MTVSIPANGSSVYLSQSPDWWPTTNNNIKYTIRVRLNWQSIPENRSSIHVDVIAWRTNTGYTTYGSGTAYFQNGANQSWDSQSISPSQTITYNSDTVLFSKDVFVYHDVNGNATTQLGAYFSISGIVSASEHNEYISLPQIPRNALLDSVTGATKFGDTATLSMSRILAGRYYRLDVLYGATVIDTTDFTSVDAPASKKMEEDWQKKNTSSASTSLTFRLTTYSNEARTAQVGSTSSKGITLAPSIDAAPTFTFNDLVHNGTLSTPNVPNIWNTFVQNKSGAVATISSLNAKYEASITSVVITGNGESASGTSGSTTLTTGPLATAGTMTFTAVVTDSRGLTATAHKSITVAAYKAPVIHTMLSRRSSAGGMAASDGTYMLVKSDYSFSAVGTNSANLKIYAKESNTPDTNYLQVEYYSGSGWATDIGIGDDVVLLVRNSDSDSENEFATDKSYDIKYVATDALSTSYKVDLLSVSTPMVEWNAAGEMGIGQEPVAGKALAVGGDTLVDGDLDIDGALTLLTALGLIDGGTGATDAAGARANLHAQQTLSEVAEVGINRAALSGAALAVQGKVDINGDTDITGNIIHNGKNINALASMKVLTGSASSSGGMPNSAGSAWRWTNTQTVNFASAFASVPIVIACISSTTGVSACHVRSKTTGSFTWMAFEYGSADAGRNVTIDYIAIGT